MSIEEDLKAATIRATAAESALAEARGALAHDDVNGLRDAVYLLGPNGLRSVQRTPSIEWVHERGTRAIARIDAALARAGEQEAEACAEGEKAVQGEPASSGQDRCTAPQPCSCCKHPTPPPGEQGKGGHPRGRWFCKTCRHDHLAGTGCMRARYAVDGVTIEKCDCTAEPEQGKGGGEGLEEILRREHTRLCSCGSALTEAGTCIAWNRAYAARALAPAQPAEHPAKEK